MLINKILSFFFFFGTGYSKHLLRLFPGGCTGPRQGVSRKCTLGNSRGN